ncbi:MAG TPA: alkaline phosphatase family protein [Flavobacteriales bacterium]|jgi:alkaline phosphatase D|nr:alkaline phosphatase family protein [Flavobacteriales bacterium]
MKKIVLLALVLFTTLGTYAQKSLLQSGPMIGRVNKIDVKLWAQTKKPAKVKFAYWEAGKLATKKWSDEVRTNKDDAYTAHIIIDGLKPNTTYNYQIYINNKKVSFDFPTSFTTQDVWLFHHAPADFNFAFGSGAYINDPLFDRSGRPYGGQYEIYQSIADKKPNFMIWDGDNIYLRQNEWDSKSGVVYRYTHDWSIPEKKQLFATVPHYAILDDHDFGPNDSDGSFWNKNTTEEVFNLFWANPKPVSGLKSATYQFSYNDADFFLLDNRYYRDPNVLKTKDPKTILGKKQLEWLKKALAFSKARFKFIVMGGQFLSTVRNWETYNNNGFDKERLDIIDFIYKQGLKNVIFLTGDRHMSEISLLDNGKAYPKIWDVTVSPFTSGPNTHAENEPNRLRVPNTLIMQRNFAIFKIEGKGKDRHVKINFYDQKGKLIKDFTIKQDLTYGSKKSRKH